MVHSDESKDWDLGREQLTWKRSSSKQDWKPAFLLYKLLVSQTCQYYFDCFIYFCEENITDAQFLHVLNYNRKAVYFFCVCVSPVHTIKACSSGSDIAPLFLNLGIRSRWVANFLLQLLDSCERTLVPIE